MLLCLLKLIVKVGVLLTGIAFLIVMLPGLPPHFQFQAFSLPPTQSLEGVPRLNIFDKAEVILEGEVIGAESIAAVKGGEVFYAGTEHGHVVKFEGGKLEHVARTGKDCAGSWEGHVCGRPLGLRLETPNSLVLADCYKGLFRLNLKTNKLESLFDYTKPIEGRVPKFADDLDVGQDGAIYWSDVSTNTDYANQFQEFFINSPTGRLIKFDPKTKTNTVLLDGIHFANGVQLSRNQDFILLSETVRSRVHRYYLKGPKAGESDVFVEGLPGWPDNIRSNGKGGFYVALVAPMHDLALALAPSPLTRKLVARIRGLAVGFLDYIREFVPDSHVIGEVRHYVSVLGPIGKPPRSLVQPSSIVELNENGKIIRVLEGDKNKLGTVTEMTVTEKYAYFGSFVSNKVWRVKMEHLK